MSNPLRTVLFWLHLVSGVVAGLVILVMSLTGAALAFQPQLLAWAERDLQTVAAPAPGTERLPVEQLLAAARAAAPAGAKPSAVTLGSAPTAAAMVQLGREGRVYVNPYTAEVRTPPKGGMRAVLHTLEDLHRFLGAEGERRAVGKAVTGASNLAFLVLALTGLVLWWPRRWTWAAVRSTLWFRRGLKGKARDFNWHNATGFWALPVLVVLTTSGAVISYRWASDGVFKLMGSPVPAAGPGAGPSARVPPPPAGAQPLGTDVLLARAAEQVPGWQQLTLRLASPQGQGGPQGQGERGPRAEGAPRGEGSAQPAGPQPFSVTVKEKDAWPTFASVQVALDPYTGATLAREGYADQNRGRQVRSWLRFLHTGEALGWVGQLLAGLASLGGGLLVWTGLALSWRRFLSWRRTRAAAPAPAAGLSSRA